MSNEDNVHSLVPRDETQKVVHVVQAKNSFLTSDQSRGYTCKVIFYGIVFNTSTLKTSEDVQNLYLNHFWLD